MSEAAPRATTTGWPAARIVALLLGLTALRLAVAGATGLVDDEAYYRLWSEHLAPGYLDHAPVIAWMIAAGRAIAGDGPLGVRFLAPFATLVGSLMLWRGAALLSGRETADRAVVWFNAMLLIGAGSVLVTPDGPSVFFWGATIWAMAELVAARDPRWWLMVGVTAGCGLASKYSVLFLGIGILVWLVAAAENRRWFRAWQLWAGGAIAALIFAPVLHWNATHEWVSFAKQFGRTVPHGFRPEKFGEFVGVQLLLIGLPMVPFLVVGVRAAAKARDAAGLLVLATSAPFLAYLVFHSMHGGIEGNWPAPLYAGLAWLAARGAGETGELSDAWRGRLERLRPWVAPVGFALTGLVYLHVLVPLVVLPANRDPTAQMKGWPAFGRALEAKAAEVGATAFAGPNYTLASQLAATLGARRVVPFDERVRYIDLPVLDPTTVCATVLDVERPGREPTAEVRALFGTVTPLGTLARTAGGRVVEDHPLFLLSDAKACGAAKPAG